VFTAAWRCKNEPQNIEYRTAESSRGGQVSKEGMAVYFYLKIRKSSGILYSDRWGGIKKLDISEDK
jgi:hypothetical protein